MPEDLQAQRRDLIAEKEALRTMSSRASKRMTSIDSEIQRLAQLATPPSRPALRISDHALLQYLARKYQLNLEELRTELLPQDEQVLAAIIKLGDGIYPVHHSHRIVVKEATVVTVLPLAH